MVNDNELQILMNALRLTVFTVALLWLSHVLRAQGEQYEKYQDKSNYVHGYVILPDGTKRGGMLKVPSLNKLFAYSQVNMVDKAGVKHTHQPRELKGYQLGSRRFVSDGKRFLEVVIDGPVLLCEYKYWQYMTVGPGSAGTSRASSDFYVRWSEEEAFEYVKGRKFKERWGKRLAACPDVQAAVQNEELRYRDMETIIRQYNRCLRPVPEKILEGF
ncbi:hypothetical protein SAMN05421823_104382 [Catalinimonas alkaloidigena]|uniref:Uncharacterized protein n=1 Tax=Catalinimonas alkaloidigena TaxID=1075417 RepID=A0A1G9HBR6_9BACT|nr:hypothetical protein [Catalinimonas alkaloidigena]SDL10302.1 hypothetical protein SAMN05421823_104382 [Catalinimonas alkaloidigena]